MFPSALQAGPKTGGVRVVHDTARSGIVTVPNLSRPFPQPQACPSCQVVHQVKTYHINVNADGAAIVSPTVFQGLKQAGAFVSGFRVDAHVPEPPKQVIGYDGRRFRELKQRDKIALWHD